MQRPGVPRRYRGRVYPPIKRFPWTLLHVVIVSMMAAGAVVTLTAADEGQHAVASFVVTEGERFGPVDLSSTSDLSPAQSQQADDLALVPPVYVPPPQSQLIQGAPFVREHVLPPVPCVDDPSHPTFCVYTVQPGDTLSDIAVRFGIAGNENLSAVEMLAQSNKPDVISSDEIVPGQRLRLPARTGIIHTVFSATTLSEIAVLYGVGVEEVIAVPENGLSADGLIVPGQDILIPDPLHLPPVVAPELPPVPTPAEEAPEEPTPEPTEEPVDPTPVETPEPEETPEPIETPEPEDTPEPDPDDDILIVSDLGDRPTDPSQYGFVWPAWGSISSYFGPGHPLGIDIDLYQDPNQPIGAAKSGVVTFAGGNACCSYGLYVIIDHGDGTSTLYAHLAQLNVVEGQAVNRGQLLGFGGGTGYATGNHLHFEVRIGDHVVDPLIFLPEPE